MAAVLFNVLGSTKVNVSRVSFLAGGGSGKNDQRFPFLLDIFLLDIELWMQSLKSLITVNKPEDKPDKQDVNITKEPEKVPEEEQDEEPWTTLNVDTTQPLNINIRRPAPYPRDDTIPDYLHTWVEEKRSIPPWETMSALKHVMQTITHENETYIVLDELRD